MSTPTARRPARRLPRGHVPAIGSTRRLRALAADGWPLRVLARATRSTVETLRLVRTGRRESLPAHLATRIAEAYDVLGGRTPESVLPPTSRAARAVRHARATARRAGWAGVDAWAGVDLDDPDTTPDTGLRTWRDDRFRNTTALELLDLIDHCADMHRRNTAWNRMHGDEKRAVVATLVDRGHQVKTIADLVGVHERAVQRYRDITQPIQPAAWVSPCPRSIFGAVAA